MNRPNSDTAVRRTDEPRRLGRSRGAGVVIPALQADTVAVPYIVPQ